MNANRAFWLVPLRHVVPADLEAWFEQRAAEGLHAERLGQWSSVRMRMVGASPATYRYVVDAQVSPRSDYRATYEDLGWEHVGQMASMHVWRRPYAGKRPEAFTDSATMAQRNGRFAVAAGVAAAVMLGGATGLGIAAAVADLAAGDRVQLWIAAGFFGAIGAAITVAAISIARARKAGSSIAEGDR